MKKLIFVLMFFNIIVYGQTEWRDPGTVYNGVHLKEISFEGIISDKDTLKSLPFDLSGCDSIITFWSYANQSNDSVRLLITRESSGIPDLWPEYKIIHFDNGGNNIVKLDTMKYHTSSVRLKLIGLSGNGNNTKFKIKITGAYK